MRTRITSLVLLISLFADPAFAISSAPASSCPSAFIEQALILRLICRPSHPTLTMLALAAVFLSPMTWSQIPPHAPAEVAQETREIKQRETYKIKLAALLQDYKEAPSDAARRHLERDFLGIIEEVQGFNALPELCETSDQTHDWLSITLKLLDTITISDANTPMGEIARQNIADARLALTGVNLELENKRELEQALLNRLPPKLPIALIPETPSDLDFIIAGCLEVGFVATAVYWLFRRRNDSKTVTHKKTPTSAKRMKRSKFKAYMIEFRPAPRHLSLKEWLFSQVQRNTSVPLHHQPLEQSG